MKAYLNDNVYSYFKNGGKEVHQYGSKGEKVTVISDKGNVMVVEGLNGKRFPVEAEKVTKVINNDSAQI